MNFDKSLNLILEDTSIFDTASAQLDTIDALQNNLKDANRQLRRESGILCSTLAKEIRKFSPDLYIGLDKYGCLNVSYRNGNKVISLKPDIRDKKWIVGDGAFERKFKRYHGHVLDLEPDVIAKSIAEFFNNHYKSLGK